MADRIISGILFRVTKSNFLDWLSVRTVDQMSCLRLLKKNGSVKDTIFNISTTTRSFFYILLSFALTLSQISPTEKSMILSNVRVRLIWSPVAKTSKET